MKKMIKDKRGLSGVVTTLVIIALALAAVAIVWYVVTNVLTTSQAEVEEGTTNLFSQCPAADVTDATDSESVCEGEEAVTLVGGQYCCVAPSE